MNFPAPDYYPGQAQSRLSLRLLESAGPKPAWWLDFLAIRDAFPHFRNWRIWVYIAWCGQPAGSRDPATVEELARDVLGCSSRAVRKWQAADYGEQASIAEAVAWVQAAPLLRARREIYEALIEVAKKPDPKAHNDRRLALEMLGDYRPKGVNSPDEAEAGKVNDWLADLRRAA